MRSLNMQKECTEYIKAKSNNALDAYKYDIFSKHDWNSKLCQEDFDDLHVSANYNRTWAIIHKVFCLQ